MATIGALTFYEYNDEIVLGTLYEDVAKTIPLDLTDMTVEFIYKTSNAQADLDAVILTADITNPAMGEIRVDLSDTTVDMAKKFFRIDVVSGPNRRTAVYGTVSVVDL